MVAEILIIGLSAFAAAALTFFSGFGLGTLLMPVVALFFSVELAIAITAVVHLANNLFKLGLLGPYARLDAVVRFGIPALAAAYGGAWLLESLSAAPVVISYNLAGVEGQVTAINVVVGLLILLFVAIQVTPALANLAFPVKWMPVGGLLSGFFGGLSGHHGALRSMFLIRAGLTKEAYLGTGVAVAVLVDLSRLAAYGFSGLAVGRGVDWSLVGVAIASALAGSWVCSRFLSKVSLRWVENLVSVLLLVIGVGLIAGII